jgi:hypothetical protein
MALCLVVFAGLDPIDHEETVEADSLFAAADLAIRKNHRFWWYDPSRPITVKQGEREWKVMPDRVRAWERKNEKRIGVATSKKCQG